MTRVLVAASLLFALLAPTIAAQEQSRESVAPGVNARFVDPNADPETFVQMFETESREIYRFRERIVEELDLEPGMEVADVGAGTGLFSRLIADVVGPEGTVYAVDISMNLLDHIDLISEQEGIANIRTVLAGETTSRLEPDSVDLIFVCDTYHHFEYPQETLTSLHEALRPDGRLVLIDFVREEGTSNDWVLEHVRAGEETVTAELEAAGFERVRELDFMDEQYFLEFRLVDAR